MPYFITLPFALANMLGGAKWLVFALWPALASVPLGDERAAGDRPAVQAARQVEAPSDDA